MMRRRQVLTPLVFATLLFSASAAPARAEIVGTARAIAMSERAETLQRVHSTLERREMAEQLEALGVDREHAMARIAALTDAELGYLRERLDHLPAGGSTLEVIGAALLVLVILDVLGITDIFTFIK